MSLIKRVISNRITQSLYKILFKMVGYFPRKNIIMFESFLGKQYSCNPRALYEYLKENNFDYDMYWSIDPRYTENFKGRDIQYINRFSIKWLFLMAQARFWISNSRMPLWIPKPKNTVYLQTWHGTPLKKLAADIEEVHMPGTTTEQYKQNFSRETKNWDYLISPNSYSTQIFKRAFEFNNEMLETGYPRNDFLYAANNEKSIIELKNKYLIPAHKKVILYAPTWRDDHYFAVGKYKFDLELDLKRMQERLGNGYVVLLRMHYLVAGKLDLKGLEEFAFDFSHHEDIRELYVISDLLVTDYSSVFFDYANLKRPIIFFVYDIENYRDKLRGFYIDFEKNAPGPLVKTTDEVIDNIESFAASETFELENNYQNFYDEFCYLECGESSKRVIEKLFYNEND
jgi:CDP-glycerol glycerophosphotransferase